MRRAGAFLALACFGLAGCDGAGMVTSSAVAPREVAVTGDNVVIAAPAGYCVDQDATREGNDSAIVVLAKCNALAGKGNQAGGLLTATVSPQSARHVAGAIEGLAAHFASPAGRAALSQDGNPESVALLDTVTTQDTLFLHLQERSGVLPGLSRDYWRAMFDVDGRIATISVRAFVEDPLPAQNGLSTAKDFASQIRKAN